MAKSSSWLGNHNNQFWKGKTGEISINCICWHCVWMFLNACECLCYYKSSQQQSCIGVAKNLAQFIWRQVRNGCCCHFFGNRFVPALTQSWADFKFSRSTVCVSLWLLAGIVVLILLIPIIIIISWKISHFSIVWSLPLVCSHDFLVVVVVAFSPVFTCLPSVSLWRLNYHRLSLGVYWAIFGQRW